MMTGLPALRVLTKEALSSRSMKASFFWATFLIAALWLLAAWKFLPLRFRTEPVVLHYSVTVGIDRLAAWYWTLSPPAFATLVYLVNGVLTLSFWRKGRHEIALMIGLFTGVLLSLFFIATFLLVLLNVGV